MIPAILSTNEVESEFCFELFDDILLMTSKPLAVVLGTKSAAFKGKSSLIPLFFEGLHHERSIFRSALNEQPEFTSDSVDVICNQEYGNKWIVADFHSRIHSVKTHRLLKAFSSFSSLILLNATIDDFGPNCKLGEEVVNYLDSFMSSQTVILLVRDFKETDQTRLNAITSNIELGYNSMKIHVIAVENVSQDSPWNEKMKNKLKKTVSDIKSGIDAKPMGSIKNIEAVFNDLNDGVSVEAVHVGNHIETKFRALFIEDNEEQIKNIFPIARKSAQIKKLQEEIHKVGYNNPERRSDLEKKLADRKIEMVNLRPISEHIKFFIEILLGETYLKDLNVFEGCLIDFKREKLEKLKKSRNSERNKLRKLVRELTKLKALENKHEDDINDKNEEIETSKKLIIGLDESIETLNLTMDKFWDELFATYNWIMEKQANSSPYADEEIQKDADEFVCKVDALIDRFIILVKYGFSIHILRGQPLKLESKMLERVFDKAKKNQDILVITVIGEQSSAKSSLLNALFGQDFRTSSCRCTLGIYMNFATYKDKLIVILDTEGLMSVEGGNHTIDNQLATMAIMCSHLIIINTKGEISANLERLLGVTFYAKMHTMSSKFKPLIMFVLRDQRERDHSDHENQASLLMNKLIESTKNMDISVDDIMNINVNDVILMPSAFAEHDKITWRSDEFPQTVLMLRNKIIRQLEAMSSDGLDDQFSFKSLASLYSSMKSYWSLLVDLGDGILTCKDLEEIKVRKEIAAKFEKLTDEYLLLFRDECFGVIEVYKEKLNAICLQSEIKFSLENARIDEAANLANLRVQSEIDVNLNEQINNKCDEFYQTVSQEFNKEIKLFEYPENIKIEYEEKIKIHLQRIKLVALSFWNNYFNNALETNAIENVKIELMVQVSALLMNNSVSDEQFDELIKQKFSECQLAYTSHLEKKFPTNDEYLRKIENLFISEHKHYAFLLKKHFVFGTLNDFGDYVNKCELKTHSPFSVQNWFKDKLEDKVKEFFKSIDWFGRTKKKKVEEFKESNKEFKYEDVIDWVIVKCLDIIPNVVEFITKPFVEDSHIKRAIHIIQDSFLADDDSPLIKFKSKLQPNELLSNIIRFTLYEMWKHYIYLKKKDMEENKKAFKKMINQLEQQITSNKDSMKGCRDMGDIVGLLMSMNLKRVLIDKSDTNAKTQIGLKISEILQNPERILHQAFERSFKSYNYEAVYKYVNNIVKYCTEIAQQMVKESVKTIVINEKNDLKSSFNKFLDAVSSFQQSFIKKANCKYSIHSLIDEMRESIQDEKLKSVLVDVKKSITDNEIDKIDHFLSSFSRTLLAKLKEFVEKTHSLDLNLENMAQSHTESLLKQMIGCKACCPGCGSKCNLDSDHTGSHRTCHHIYSGFNGWRLVHNNEVRTYLCWEKQFYMINPKQVDEKDSDGNVKTVVFKGGLKEYLENRHVDWVADIQEHNVKFSQNLTTNIDVFKEYEYTLRKCWMNVKEPILEKFSLKDKEYNADWMREIEDRKLPRDFKIPGY